MSDQEKKKRDPLSPESVAVRGGIAASVGQVVGVYVGGKYGAPVGGVAGTVVTAFLLGVGTAGRNLVHETKSAFGKFFGRLLSIIG